MLTVNTSHNCLHETAIFELKCSYEYREIWLNRFLNHLFYRSEYQKIITEMVHLLKSKVKVVP